MIRWALAGDAQITLKPSGSGYFLPGPHRIGLRFINDLDSAGPDGAGGDRNVELTGLRTGPCPPDAPPR